MKGSGSFIRSYTFNRVSYLIYAAKHVAAYLKVANIKYDPPPCIARPKWYEGISVTHACRPPQTAPMVLGCTVRPLVRGEQAKQLGARVRFSKGRLRKSTENVILCTCRSPTTKTETTERRGKGADTLRDSARSRKPRKPGHRNI